MFLDMDIVIFLDMDIEKCSLNDYTYCYAIGAPLWWKWDWKKKGLIFYSWIKSFAVFFLKFILITES